MFVYKSHRPFAGPLMAFEEIINGCHIYVVRMLGIELIDDLSSLAFRLTYGQVRRLNEMLRAKEELPQPHR